MGMMSVPYIYSPRGYQQLTAGTATPGTVLTVPSGGARFALLRVAGTAATAVRWRDDGGTPTASAGMPLDGGDVLEYSGNLATFKVIGNGAAAVVDIAYYA